jgi:hypothetical protein
MKLLKIDRLRGLSIGCMVLAVLALVAEFSSPKFDAHFFILTMIIMITALEEVRTELRELKEKVDNQRRVP